jgi:hypothetical protein
MIQEHMDEIETSEEMLQHCLDNLFPLLARDQYENMSPHVSAVVRNLILVLSLKLIQVQSIPKVYIYIYLFLINNYLHNIFVLFFSHFFLESKLIFLIIL